MPKLSNQSVNSIKNHLENPSAEIPSKKCLRTGCLLLDLVVGGGESLGFPYGKIINLVGDKSSGKTFLACEIIAKNFWADKKSLVWNYDDGESGFTFDTQRLWSMDIMDKKTEKSRTIEEFDINTTRFLKKLPEGKIGIYVLDSLDGLSNAEIDERSEERYKAAEAGKALKEKGTYGMKTPKFLSQEFFRTKTGEFSRKDATLIIVSQVRDNLDPFSFKKYVRAGGKAMDFYAHTCLWLSTVSKIIKKDRVIGVVVNAKTDKSKTPRPFRECTFSLYFDYGIDDIGSSLDYLFDLRGKDGKLKDNSNFIQWHPGGEKTVKKAVEFLTEKKVIEDCRAAKEKIDGKHTLSLSFIDQWVSEQSGNLQEAYKAAFGETFSREELIGRCQTTPDMRAELETRVVQKWEDSEKAVATNRPKKYGTE